MNISRILKLIWAISFVSVSFVLFYVYAGLGEMVAYSGDVATSLDYIDKDLFFYFFLALIALMNGIIYFAASKQIGKRTLSSHKLHRVIGWEYGLAVVINLFLSISMIFLSVFNSGEKFEYSNFGYLVYFSLGLVILWVISFPFVLYSARVRV